MQGISFVKQVRKNNNISENAFAAPCLICKFKLSQKMLVTPCLVCKLKISPKMLVTLCLVSKLKLSQKLLVTPCLVSKLSKNVNCRTERLFFLSTLYHSQRKTELSGVTSHTSSMNRLTRLGVRYFR